MTVLAALTTYRLLRFDDEPAPGTSRQPGLT